MDTKPLHRIWNPKHRSGNIFTLILQSLLLPNVSLLLHLFDIFLDISIHLHRLHHLHIPLGEELLLAAPTHHVAHQYLAISLQGKVHGREPVVDRVRFRIVLVAAGYEHAASKGLVFYGLLISVSEACC